MLQSQTGGSETRIRKALRTRKKNRGNLGSYGRSIRAHESEIKEYLEGQTHLTTTSPCSAPIQTQLSLLFDLIKATNTCKLPMNIQHRHHCAYI